MRQLVSKVDRLQRLAIFEAAARLGSFSAAGRELSIAQPAITRQIRALETTLGVELFERTSNRSELTEAGRRFADSLDVNFAGIEHTIHEITTLDDTFVFATPPGFSQQLIVPELDSLQRALGDRDLRLWLYDRESELAGRGFDAAIRIGAGSWPGVDCVELFEERVVAIATPALAHQWGLDGNSEPADILRAPLLHMDAADRPWMSWADWFGQFDLALTKGRRRVVFNNYPTVLQQVMAGRGVGLGWIGLVDELVADGLVCIVGPTVTWDRSYYVTWPMRRPSSAVTSLVAWLEQRLESSR